jgi:putative hemolysin
MTASHLSLGTRATSRLPCLDRNADWKDYPVDSAGVPALDVEMGDYRLRFARSREDLDKVFRLRFEVYNLELNEGLEESYATGRDVDPWDSQCHHLLVEYRKTGALVGTYRMQVGDIAARHLGFYSDREFRLVDLPGHLWNDAVEVGRACIERSHRNGRVLQGLWKGIAHYMQHNQKRYLFGCCSLASRDPKEGLALMDSLRAAGNVHPEWLAMAQPTYRMPTLEGRLAWHAAWTEKPVVEVPRLMQGYLNLGGCVISEPAVDGEFKTIDYLVLVDRETMPRGLFQRFLGRSEAVSSR